MDLDRVKKTMRGNVFIDLRNVYEPELMRCGQDLITFVWGVRN